MTTEAAGLGLTDVLAAHDVSAPRGYAGEVCTCGWESDLERYPEGQAAAHVAEQVRTWLLSRDVETPAARALNHYYAETEHPSGEGAWRTALAAVAETLGAK